MLKISKQSMDALKQVHEKRFADYMMDYLNREVPEVVQDATPEELQEFICDGIQRGRTHGFEEGTHIEQYILYMAWVGSDFDVKEPWAIRILADDSLEPEDKIFQLEDAIMTEWEGSRGA